MQGPVRTVFGNVTFIDDNCATPIRSGDDPETVNIGSTCSQIEYSAQSYTNYQRYLSTWNDIRKSANGSSNPSQRPQGYALLNENTTVTGSWIDIVDIAKASAEARRIVNNVSMAMPHAGVSLAAYDEKNRIIQPKVCNRANYRRPISNLHSP
jgi:hypothetical protein